MNKMAKTAIALVALTAAFSFAQDSEKKGMQIGPRLSLGSFSTPSMVIQVEEKAAGQQLARPNQKIDGGLSFGGGVAVKIPVASFVEVAPEVNFLYRKVAHWDGLVQLNGVIPKMEMDITEFAISVPILALITLPEGVVSLPAYAKGIFLEVGPQIDLPLATKRKETWTRGIPTFERKFEERATVDVGLVVGLGYNITKNIAVDVRYVLGFTSFADNDKADELAKKNDWTFTGSDGKLKYWGADFKSTEQMFLSAIYYF